MIDPQDPRAYRAAVLDWSEADAPGHREMLDLYRRLIALRAAHPALRDPRLDRMRVDYDECARWLVIERGPLRVVANLAAQEQPVPAPAGEVLLRTGAVSIEAGRVVLASESAAIVTD
jgi:maltooligosyltrehalose trehalohydrolase